MTAKFDRRSVLKLGGGMLAASALLPHQAFAQQTAINYWHTFTSQSEFAGLDEVMKLFAAAHPEVAVTQENIPNPEFMAKVTAAVVSGSRPDVTMVSSERFADLLAMGALNDLTDKIAAWDRRSDFDDVRFASISKDGKVYGVPAFTFVDWMYYRKDWFERPELKEEFEALMRRWHERLSETVEQARRHAMRVVMFHAHIGSGPRIAELVQNLHRLVHGYASLLAQFPDVRAVSLGGGIPHAYRETEPAVDVVPLRELFTEARAELQKAAQRDVRVEIEPGDEPFGLWVSNDAFKDERVFTDPRLVAATNARLKDQPYKAMIYPTVDPKTGEPVEDGERGELVFTTLHKFALPLIRYRIGDLSILTNEPCDCGRTHPRILRILGRTDDMLIIRGINVFPSQVESVLMNIPEVGDHWEIIVDRKGPLDIMTVRVELTESGFSDKIGDLMRLKKKVSKELKSVLNIAAEVDLVEPGTIPRSMGKAKRVTDNRKV